MIAQGQISNGRPEEMQVTPESGKAVAVESLVFGYEGLRVLEDITFHVDRGEFVAIVGPSGCGKSTLLGILAGFLEADSDSVLIEGQRPTSPTLRRGVVFQEYALFPWRTTVRNIEFALEGTGRVRTGSRKAKEERRDRAMELLRMVGLESFAESYPHQLSGGMKQRVAIARALACDPELLLMDEPLGALDALTRESLIVEIGRILERTKQTVVYVTHNVVEAVTLADRVVVFESNPGRIQEIIDIPMPRPREPLSDDVVAHERKIRSLLGAGESHL